MAPSAINYRRFRKTVETFPGSAIARIQISSLATTGRPICSFIPGLKKPLAWWRWRARPAARRSSGSAAATWIESFFTNRRPGRARILPKRWPMRLRDGVRKSSRCSEAMPPGWRRSSTAGRGCSSNCFAFIVRDAQTIEPTATDERTTAIHHSQLSQVRPGSGPAALLPNGLPRGADRPGLRGSTVVRRFSHDLLHRSRTRVLLCPGNRRRDPRLSSGLATTVAKSALLLLAERVPFHQGAHSLLSLQSAVPTLYSLAFDVWLA